MVESGSSQALFERVDLRERYLTCLRGAVETERIKKKKLRVVVDCLFGSARGYFDLALQRLNCQVIGVNDYRDVLFGGEKTIQKEINLKKLQQKVAQEKADLGLLFTENGDDLAIVGKKGRYVSAKELFASFEENVATGDSFQMGLKAIEVFAQQKINLL